jgi:hypothetical protein
MATSAQIRQFPSAAGLSLIVEQGSTIEVTVTWGQGCLKVILDSSRCSPSSLWRSQKASADRILLVARAMSCNFCPDFEAALHLGGLRTA